MIIVKFIIALVVCMVAAGLILTLLSRGRL
jgi:hypothetical protein